MDSDVTEICIAQASQDRSYWQQHLLSLLYLPSGKDRDSERSWMTQAMPGCRGSRLRDCCSFILIGQQLATYAEPPFLLDFQAIQANEGPKQLVKPWPDSSGSLACSWSNGYLKCHVSLNGVRCFQELAAKTASQESLGLV